LYDYRQRKLNYRSILVPSVSFLLIIDLSSIFRLTANRLLNKKSTINQ